MTTVHDSIWKHGLTAGAIAPFLATLILAGIHSAAIAQERVEVEFTREVRAEPFSGRVYVFFARRPETGARNQEPRVGPNWFKPAPIISADVEQLQPGERVELSLSSAGRDSTLPPVSRRKTLIYPPGLEARSLAGLNAQAVIRFNPLEREVGNGAGNGYSAAAVVPESNGVLRLVVDRLVPPVEVTDTEWTKVLRVRSRLLGAFHGRTVEMAGAVRLPPSYHTSPDRRYPVVFEVPGFGGALRHAINPGPYSPETAGGVEFIHVFLDPNCPLGHHVFADSANNGPVGQALIDEFIPALDERYRTTASPQGRFLTGHSSGGWSSLWLQISYPDVFNGTWSTAPDPVDFRDFQRIDLYRAGENMYVDPSGARRPLARIGGRTVIWYDDFSRLEEVLGPGGQLHSFEAVFSDRGPDGRPRLIWNRQTGAVDSRVAESWKRYDIRLILEENWAVLGPKLAGKLHVFMGGVDTFYLEGATKLLKESLQKLGSDAVVEIHPGADHSTLMTPELKARIPREMAERYLRTGGR